MTGLLARVRLRLDQESFASVLSGLQPDKFKSVLLLCYGKQGLQERVESLIRRITG